MGSRPKTWWYSEIQEGLKMRNHPDPELRRRNRLRVKHAVKMIRNRNFY